MPPYSRRRRIWVLARRSRLGVSKRVLCSKVRGVSRWKPRWGSWAWRACGSATGNFSSISAACIGEVYGLRGCKTRALLWFCGFFEAIADGEAQAVVGGKRAEDDGDAAAVEVAQAGEEGVG